MKRLYFLLPDIKSANKIVDELLLARIEQRRIHIAAKDHHPLQEANLPEASLLQESDFIPAVEKGLAVGGGTGILAGLVAMSFPPAGMILGGGAVLGLGLLGAGFGAWMSMVIYWLHHKATELASVNSIVARAWSGRRRWPFTDAILAESYKKRFCQSSWRHPAWLLHQAPIVLWKYWQGRLGAAYLDFRVMLLQQ